MKKRHVMRALVAAATALALTACGSTGSSDTSKSTSTTAASTASAASTSSGSEADTENTITIPAGESVSQDSDGSDGYFRYTFRRCTANDDGWPVWI